MESKQTLAGYAKRAGDILNDLLQGDETTAKRLSSVLKSPPGRETSDTAALILIYAIALLPERTDLYWLTNKERINSVAKSPNTIRPQPVQKLASLIIRALKDRQCRPAMLEINDAGNLVRSSLQEIRTKDPAGQALQALAPLRKERAVYHTRPETAELMAHLAIPADLLAWDDPEAIKNLKIADYACGSGVLLAAAYRRVRDLHYEAGGDPASLHRDMMHHSITGTDISPAAVAIAAENLATLAPNERYLRNRLAVLNYGPIETEEPDREPRRTALGAFDLLDPKKFEQDNLMGQDRLFAIAKPKAKNDLPKDCFKRYSQDLIIMNPPFSKPVNHQALDQNYPVDPSKETTPAELQNMARDFRALNERHNGVPAISAAYYFATLARQNIKRNGVIALILPNTALAQTIAKSNSPQDTNQKPRKP